jgi:hypothetical protein
VWGIVVCSPRVHRVFDCSIIAFNCGLVRGKRRKKMKGKKMLMMMRMTMMKRISEARM